MAVSEGSQERAWPDARPGRLRLAAYAACIVTCLVLCWPWISGTYTIPYDAKAHFHAQLQFLANALHSNQSPFWNPNEFGGQPQIADPQSLIFSPAILIALLEPFPGIAAVDYYAFALLAAAALCVLSFCLDRGWHAIGAAVAAIAFAFGASAAWRIQHIGQIQSYALFAVTLWLLGRALQRRSPAWGCLAGVAAGLMLVESNQIVLMSCYLLAGFVVVEVARSESPTRLRDAAPALAAAGLATLVIAIVPVVLTYLFLEGSTRPEISMAEAGRGSLHPASLLTAVIGDLFGALDPKVEYWGPYSPSWSPDNLTLSQNMGQIYTGILPALLVLTFGLAGGRVWRRDIRFFTAALLAMVVYALGSFTPLFEMMYDLPGVNLFRRPADATFMIGGLMAIVAGNLVHQLLTERDRRIGGGQRLLEAGVILALFGSALGVAYWHGHILDALKPLAAAAAWTAAAIVLMRVLPRLAARRPLAALAVVTVFMTGDLSANNGPNESTALPRGRYEFLDPHTKNETVAFIRSALKQPPGSPRRDRIELAGLGFDWPNIGMIHGFDHDLGYNPLRLSAVSRVFGAGETIAGWDQRSFTPLFPSYRSLMADMLGLRFIAVPVPIETVDRKLAPGDLVLVKRTSDAFIYENPRALPRAMFVSNWQLANFETLIKTGEWPAFDPRQTVLLERPPTMPSPQRSIPHAPPAQVAMPGFSNTAIDIDVLSAEPGFVVLNGVWHPWWSVTVDGEARELLRANVLFRAVQVEAGRHKVRFEFLPFAGAMAQVTRRPRPVIVSHKWPLAPPT